MNERWEFHFTDEELKRLLVKAFKTGNGVSRTYASTKNFKAIAADVLGGLAAVAQERHTAYYQLPSSERVQAIEHRAFPPLWKGAGEGIRTPVSSLEGSGPDIKTSI